MLQGQTALVVACQGGFLEVVEVLLAQGSGKDKHEVS